MRIRTLAIGAASASAVAVTTFYKRKSGSRWHWRPPLLPSRRERRALARNSHRMIRALLLGSVFAFPSFGDAFSWGWSFFGNTLGDLKDWVLGVLADVWDAIMSMFDLLDTVVDWSLSQFVGTVSAIYDTMTDVVQEVAGFSEGIWRVIDESVMGALSSVWQSFDAVWEFMNEFGGDVFSFIWDIASDVFYFLWNTAIEPVWDAIQNIAGFTWDQIEALVNAAIDAALEAIDFTLGAAEAIVREGLSIIFDLGFDIFEVFVKLLEWGYWIISHPEEALIELAEETIRWARPQIEEMIADIFRDGLDDTDSFIRDLFGL